jgi:hypothetical protein
VTEGLQSAYRRLRKHISDDSGLFLPLWDRLTALLFQKFSRWASIFSKTQETNGHVPRLWICKALGKLRSHYHVFMAKPLVTTHPYPYSVFSCVARYEEIAQTCYDVKLEPSPQVIRQLAQECRSIGTGSK